MGADGSAVAQEDGGYRITRVPALPMYEHLMCKCAYSKELRYTGHKTKDGFGHHCDGCGEAVYLQSIYPRIVYEAAPRMAPRQEEPQRGPKNRS
jgi:hypothetical protein